MNPQAPEAGAQDSSGVGATLLQQLELLGWVDCTALAVLLVFFVLGLFKGLFWQVSRIVILLVSYVLAGRFGGGFGSWLSRTFAASDAGGQAPTQPSDTTLYLAYLLVFLGALIVLALVAMQLQKLVKKTGLSFFDRIGGGVFGVATGACAVLFGLFVVNMFFRDTSLGRVAEASESQRLSRQAIDWLGDRVPDEVREVLELAPFSEPETAPGEADSEGAAPPGIGPPERQPDPPPAGGGR